MALKTLGVWMLVAAATACAGRAPSSGTPSAARRDRNVITQAELSDPALSALNVLEVVWSLRPHFLSDRGTNSQSDAEAGKVHASIDNSSILSVQELRNVHANRVVEIRYLDAGAAMQRFGGAAREGPVILVKTM